MNGHRFICVVLSLAVFGGSLAQSHARDQAQSIDLSRSRVAPADPTDAEGFRSLMVAWTEAMEASLGDVGGASSTIAAMSTEAVQAWFELAATRPGILAAVRRDLAGLARPSQPESATRGASATLFPPDYPPQSGAYQSSVFAPLESAGLASSIADRCDTAALAEKFEVWEGLNEIADDADIACVIAGCDPTGVACAIACAIIEGAKLAAKIALRPIELCEVHDANIDAAEIEAAYENSLVNFAALGEAKAEILAEVQAAENNILAEIRSDRDFALRLEIEKALRHDIRIASFFLPEAHGGQLSLVRQIVVETIDAVVASGESVTAAHVRLALGDAAAGHGRYKDAFHFYARAYFQAVSILGDVQ